MGNISIVSTAIISLFLVAIILGFLFGWLRGFSKSLIRFIMVLGMAVLAFFVVPALTKVILQADISRLNININGIQVITIEDLIGDLLRKIPMVEDLISSSATLESFIKLLPFMIANVVLFIIFFFVLKYISLIIYWIIAGVCFSKKKTEGKDKHKFVGAIIGAVQGLLIACVCFVPVFGVVDTAQPVLQAAIAENIAAAESSEETTDPETAMAVYNVEAEETQNYSEMIDRAEKAAAEVDKYTSAFDNTWIVKVLNSIGVRKLSVSMFDSLTTITENDVTYSLRAEVKSFANVVPQIKAIAESGLDLTDNVCIDKIQAAAKVLCEDEVFGNIIKEVVPTAAQRWHDGYKFCNISRPNINNEAVNTLFDSVLDKVRLDEGRNIQNDVDVAFEILKICNDAELISTIKNNGDIVAALTAEDNKNLISDIIGKALESKTLKNVMPEIVNFGLDVVYKALDAETSAEVTINAQDINWEEIKTGEEVTDIGEKARIQKIFTNMIKIYSDIDKARQEERSTIEAFDFGLMGETFDYLRDSSLLKAGKKGETEITSVSKDLIETLFDSNKLGSDEVARLADFKNALLDVWDSPDVSLKDTFVALKDAMDIAKSLEDIENLDLSNLGNVIETLADNEALKSVVTEIVGNTETLTEMGLSEEVAAVVSETITNIIDPDPEIYGDVDLSKEIDALVEVFDVASQVLSAGEGEEVDISAEDANKLVDSIASSSVILDLITEAHQDEENTTYSDLGIADSLSDETKTAIENALQANQDMQEGDEGYENKLTENQLAALKALFGIADEEAGE